MTHPDELQTLVLQWKETTALLSKRDAVIGDLLRLVENRALSVGPPEEGFQQLSLECSDLRKRLRDLEKRHTAIQNVFTGDPFVVVLIDGEITLFNDSYVRLGAEGGRQASNHLAGLLQQHLTKENGPFRADWRVRPHIFGSVSKLAKYYQAAGLVQDQPTFHAFMKAFNREQGFFSAMDPAEGRDTVEHKVKRNFELFWNNRLCKYLVLGGGSKDKNYGDFLRRYTSTDEDIQRIIMLDRISFPKDMSTLAWKMTTIRSPSLFHNSDAIAIAPPKVLALPPSDKRLTPPDSPKSAGAISNQFRRSVMPDLSSLSVLPSARTLAARASKQLLKVPTFTTMPTPKTHHMSFNKDGHRIDDKLQYDPKLRNQFRDREKPLCFDHYLRDRNCLSLDCPNDHSESLSNTGLETLKWMARLTPCKRIACNDPSCYYGHQCPYKNGLCCEEICDFGPEMHNVDTAVVDKRVVAL